MTAPDEAHRSRRPWWHPNAREVVVHLFSAGVVAIFGIPFSYYQGKEVGRAQGHKDGFEVAEKNARRTIEETMAKVTPAVVEQRAKMLCASQLESQKLRSDKFHQDALNTAVEATKGSCKSAETLQTFYEIFKRHVREGGMQ